jgi:hypothetical protein
MGLPGGFGVGRSVQLEDFSRCGVYQLYSTQSMPDTIRPLKYSDTSICIQPKALTARSPNSRIPLHEVRERDFILCGNGLAILIICDEMEGFAAGRHACLDWRRCHHAVARFGRCRRSGCSNCGRVADNRYANIL